MRAMKKRLIMTPSPEAGTAASRQPRQVRVCSAVRGLFYRIEGIPSAIAAYPAVICPGAMWSARLRQRQWQRSPCGSVGLFAPVGEAGIAETGADGQHAPPFIVLHRRQLAEALHHRVVVDDDRCFMVVDVRDFLADAVGEVEAAALPVAGQVLSAGLDRAVLANDAWATDADDGRQRAALPWRRWRCAP